MRAAHAPDIRGVLAALGADPESTVRVSGMPDGWKVAGFRGPDGSPLGYPLYSIGEGPNTVDEVVRSMRGEMAYVVIVARKSGHSLLLKSASQTFRFRLDGPGKFEQAVAAINASGISGAKSKSRTAPAIRRIISAIPAATAHFINRGVFSTHYLESRLFGYAAHATPEAAEALARAAPAMTAAEILRELGWKGVPDVGTHRHNDRVTVVTTDSKDLGIGIGTRSSPSYVAVSELKGTPWVILTNGKKWRLYTSRVSAETTNYFEIDLGASGPVAFRYLLAMFHEAMYAGRDVSIDGVFDDGTNYAKEIEQDLASKILDKDGIFLDLVKGVLDHDMGREFGEDELAGAKETSLRILYRVWFLLYAESRDLLPVRDERYRPISLQYLRTRLDEMGDDRDGHSCWDALLELFRDIRKGNPRRNLPQYDGGLFAHDTGIDDILIRNRFAVPVLRGLFEKDGEAMDYASLGVRHLGSVYESLMEFGIRQAKDDIMLLVDSKGVREVKSGKFTHSYRRNDLYLASKEGIASRKGAGAYYTPEGIVKFLVRRGLDPLLGERREEVAGDLSRYKRNRSEESRRACIDRLLDLQVCDPAMGSGHFLVEVLNRITSWVTDVLREHHDHPLAEEIRSDREIVLDAQRTKGIHIDPNMLTDDVLLKRRIMKRCIFGVDNNPLAVELARVSLWMDSFAIGVPLTYMNHHLRVGDATIGLWRRDLKGDEHQTTFDEWSAVTEGVGQHIETVSSSSDLIIEQVRTSEKEYMRYQRGMAPHKAMLDALAASSIDSSIIPKGTKNKMAYIRGLVNGKICDDKTRNLISKLSDKHRFFHWELEMMDAFTDKRNGFDVLVGNPPWDKVKPYADEFFPPHHPAFRSYSKTKKNEWIQRICDNAAVDHAWHEYGIDFAEKNSFHSEFRKFQGSGDKDLWQLVLERALELVSDDGFVSILVPSQILSNGGSAEMRRQILGRDIRSLYVFENRKKIFDIHSSYRFALLTFRNREGPDEFDAGFYLHYLSTLNDGDKEVKKLYRVSKSLIQKISPTDYVIPETGGEKLRLLGKLAENETISQGVRGVWAMEFSAGFHKTNDADLLKENEQNGWPVLQGRNIHQFIHNYTRHELTANSVRGLTREKRKRKFGKMYKEIHNSYRLAFRDIASPTNMRTVITSIIPPRVFHTQSVLTVILKQNGRIVLDANYNTVMAYLCGVFNSMTLDFIARSKIQMNTTIIMPTLPIPKVTSFDDQITELAIKLQSGTREFEGLADSLHVENAPLTTGERIEAVARLDAMVAHAYGLTVEEYETVIGSFKFGEDPAMAEAESVEWNEGSNMRNFYGEVAKLAPAYYDEYAKQAGGAK